jgi:hypothetical protein
MLLDERAHAGLLLRLLLREDREDRADVGRVDWSVLLDLARQNGALLRAADRLAERAVALPAPFADAVATERRRVRNAVALVRHVSRICTAHGIEFLFAKAFQHYPDLGGDLDLLVLSPAAEVDALLAQELPAATTHRDLTGWIAGTVAFRVRDVVTPLDVQHGRLGTVGEHRAYAVTLVRNRRRIVIEGTECAVPTPEDQLVLQGVQRIYGRRSLRLSDVAYTVSSLRHDPLDWEYILGTARRIGVLAGLGCYVGYVEQIRRALFGDLLVPATVRDRLPLEGWGRVEFTRGAYRFPALRVNARLYLKQLVAGLLAANWDGAARLCLLPLVGAAVAVGRLTGAASARPAVSA